MAGARPATDPDSYYRVHKALHLVAHEAIPCVDKCLSTWHANQAIPSCTGQCPIGKKPKPQTSCQNCLAWCQAVEGAFYYQPPQTPQITWSNINPSDLGKAYVEVGKAFVLRLPHKQTKAAAASSQYNSMSDFDSASLLMIMARFAGFHYGTKSSYDTIMKVAGIRNELSHMRLQDDMQIDDQKVKKYFQDIEDLVTLLETLQPQHFTVAQVVKTKLTEIRTEPVTARMKDEINFELRRDLTDLSRKVDNLADHVSKTELKNKSANDKSEDDILHQFQEEIRFYYLNSLCKIPLFPGDYDSCVDLQDIYTKLSLEINLPQPCRPIKMPLTSYDEMFTRRTPEGYPHTKLLLSAPAGLGKTTISAKIAYDWATQVEGSPLTDITLLLVLNMRGIDHTSNLEDVILNQILADGSSITAEQIRCMIQKNEEKVVIILDAIDESDRKLYYQPSACGDIVK
ncbi:uncharacterized protein, partial [Amphiura filiformis]|uniref:uncharacterized protein n=1 Tax=Amphiura filiformis TaxID=82378 RepID=UPI003B218B2A